MTYAEPEATSHSYALLEFEPHSKPAGREASRTIWQGLVYGQRAAVKVGHPDSPDAITELHTEAHFYSEHTELQSCCIPWLLGQGWIQFDNKETPAEWLATSLEGSALSSLQSLTDAISRTLLLTVILLSCMLPSLSQQHWDMTMTAYTRCDYTVAALLATCISPYRHRCTFGTSNLC